MFSLVTACMNRDAHLRRMLPEWLRLSGLGEIVIVDWSNATPLADLTSYDSRIRVVRVEDEPRWVLSYAYNLGISHARHEVILKCDSDCLPGVGLASLQPDPTSFYAGNWQTGRPVGKASVNGQCLFLHGQFEKINGYSEFIRTYGRDDEDFYDRMKAAGFARREIPPAMLDFLPHGDEERVQNQFKPVEQMDLEAKISRHPAYNEMFNCYLAMCLPWGPQQPRASYEIVQSADRYLKLRRNKDRELLIPVAIGEEARLFSLRYLVGVLAKLPRPTTERLDAVSCLRLLAPRLAKAA
jgi:hypothetical protein